MDQHRELCERLVLVSSGGLGHSVSPLLRAASLPGSEWVLPAVSGHDLAEVRRGMADLGDREARHGPTTPSASAS